MRVCGFLSWSKVMLATISFDSTPAHTPHRSPPIYTAQRLATRCPTTTHTCTHARHACQQTRHTTTPHPNTPPNAGAGEPGCRRRVCAHWPARHRLGGRPVWRGQVLAHAVAGIPLLDGESFERRVVVQHVCCGGLRVAWRPCASHTACRLSLASPCARSAPGGVRGAWQPAALGGS